MTQPIYRLRELDFLRGLAIILVLLRHRFLFHFTENMGWVGVDLFFVLSGFLVSGLLFKEYLKFGDINPKLFLIRRGFKIYPIYYLFYLPYLIVIILEKKFDVIGFISDMTFTQNYVWGWGYAYAAAWSLAVEEHFYFAFAICLWIVLKYNKNILQKNEQENAGFGYFELSIALIFLACLIMRTVTNYINPGISARHFTMTHLRIDSLLAGVLISYLYYFKLNYLKKIVSSLKYVLPVVAVLGVAWIPFIDPLPSFFVNTVGFSFLYISFGILLVFFLLKKNINQLLDKIFTRPIVNLFSKIGYCSYSIYIIHSLVNILLDKTLATYRLYYNHYLNFIITTVLSIGVGMIMTYVIEDFFLKIRAKYYPNRTV